MKKLIIENIDKYNYLLVSENQKYKINIEFYGLSFSVKKDDIIYISKELLNEINNFVANFEKIENDDKNIIGKDVIVLVHEGKKYYLKRVYG